MSKKGHFFIKLSTDYMFTTGIGLRLEEGGGVEEGGGDSSIKGPDVCFWGLKIYYEGRLW